MLSLPERFEVMESEQEGRLEGAVAQGMETPTDRDRDASSVFSF